MKNLKKYVTFSLSFFMLLSVSGCGGSGSSSVPNEDPCTEDTLCISPLPIGPDGAPAEITTNPTDSTVRTLSLPNSDPLYFESNNIAVFSDSFNSGNALIAGKSAEGLQLFDYNLSTNTVVQKISKVFTSVSTQNHVSNGNYIYFLASDGTDNGLWRLNRTTYELLFIIEAFSRQTSNVYKNLIEFDGHLFFGSSEAATGNELYSYNLTTETAALHSDIRTGTDNSYPFGFIVHNGVMYFIADNTSSNDRIYSLSGSSATPVLLTAMSGISSFRIPSYGGMVGLGDYIYFNGVQSPSGADFLKYNINTGEYSVAAQINFIGNGSRAAQFTVFNGKVYFSAHNGQRLGTVGTELWSYDPNTEQASLVEDLYPGLRASSSDYPLNSSPIFLIVKNNKLYFSAIDGTGNTLYQMEQNEDITALNLKADGHSLIADFGNDLVVVERDGSNVYQINVSSNTITRKLVEAPNTQGPTIVNTVQAFDNNIVFTAYHPDFGVEPWLFNTQTQSLRMIRDFVPGVRSSSPNNFYLSGDRLVFKYYDADNKVRFVIYNISTRYTQVSAALDYTLFQRIFIVGDYVIFQAQEPNSETDGPFALNLNTYEVSDVAPEIQYTEEYTQVGEKVFFSSRVDRPNSGLWCFDGETGQLSKTSDIAARGIRASGSSIYYVEHNGSNYQQVVYQYNTDTNTQTILKDFTPEPESRPYYFGFHKDNFILKLDSVDYGEEAFFYDSNTDTVTLMADLNPGTGDGKPYNYISSGNKIYFESSFNNLYYVYDDVSETVSEVDSINNGLSEDQNIYFSDKNFANGKVYLPIYGGLSEVSLD